MSANILTAQMREKTSGPMQPDAKMGGRCCKAIVICRDLGGLKTMQFEAARLQSSVVVASDDPRVQKAALGCEGVDDAVFVEKMESYFCVSDEVIAVIRRINQWLEGIGREDEIPKDLLYWVMHCEGGDTSQRVLDILLLMRSYQYLVDCYNPHEIVLIRSANSSWEDDLLLAFADSVGIRARLSGRLGLARWFQRRVWLKWRPMVAGVYWTAKIVQVKLANLFRTQLNLENRKFVMVQLVSSAKSHLNHTNPLLKAINAVGLQAVVLGWRLGPSAALLRNDDMAVVELETWVTLRDLISGWMRTLKSWRRARQGLDGFLRCGAGEVSANVLRDALLDSLFAFYWRDVPQRFYLASASKKLFSISVPNALCPWTRTTEVGITAYQSLPKNDMPLLFVYGGWPYNLSIPISEAYFEKAIPNKEVVWFTISEKHSEVARKQGFLPHNLCVAGLHNGQQGGDNLTHFSPREIRKKLGLQLDGELYIFLDPNFNIRGYQTQQEQLIVLKTLFDIAKDHSELVLIVKPHPAHKPGILESIIADVALPNVNLLPFQDLPYAALEASDVVISKFSTILVQAMYIGVAGVGVILDGESSFGIYENAVDYCYSTDALRDKVVNLVEDRDYRAQWREQMKRGQQSFLSSHGLCKESNYALVIADRLRTYP